MIDNPLFIKSTDTSDSSSFKAVSGSSILDLNQFYWENLALWHSDGSKFEESLPGGVSHGNKPEFIESSFEKFAKLVDALIKENNLPVTINVLEHGPGEGVYARKFIELFNERFHELSDRFKYYFQDQSEQILSEIKNNFADVQNQIETTTNIDSLDQNSFLFIRHSNFWDQLEFDVYRKDGNTISLLKINEKESFNLDEFKTSPDKWKSYISELKFEYIEEESKDSSINATLAEDKVYSYPVGIINNLRDSFNLLSREYSGYLEVVDLFKTGEEYQDKDLLRVLDGSLFTFINEDFIKSFANSLSYEVDIRQIKFANKLMTITPATLATNLRSGQFLTINEIAVRSEQTVEDVMEEIRLKSSYGVNTIAFSDKAGDNPELKGIEENLADNLFKLAREQFPSLSFINVIASRRQSVDSINSLIRSEQINSNAIFAVTGDSKDSSQEDFLTSSDLLKLLPREVFAGAVSHTNLGKADEVKKLEAGAKYLIAQASYDMDKYNVWLDQMKKKGLLDRCYILQVIVPLVSINVLNFINSLEDIELSADLFNELSKLSEEELYKRAMDLAKEQIKKCYTQGTFSGVWIYTKNKQALADLSGFITDLKQNS